MPGKSGYQLWEVIGGADKGGIVVRLDLEMDSEKLEPRLATGAIVQEWDLVGERLQYELVSGEGPASGWVSLKFKGRDLVVKYDEKAKFRRMPRGSILPDIPRGPRCPGLSAVPEGSRKVYQKMGPAKREPRLYIIIFPGAEDEVQQGWLQVESKAPEHFEIATYEWPGHGVRKAEPFCTSMQALGDDAFEAFREPMKTNQFILCGHSIGSLVLTHVCRRAWLELGVRPHAAVVLDRGPPHLTVLSEDGHNMAINDGDKFMSIFSPHLKQGSDGYKMRKADQPLDDDTQPVGWFRFPCPVHVIAAAWTLSPEWPPPGADAKWVEVMEKIHRNLCTGPFQPEEYLLWKEWADDFTFERYEGINHIELKQHPRVLDCLHQLALRFVTGG
mmetsp:Transcript_51945/g.150916  ORF Transcript_51945/g.150916 Transcript_51945/m.150916 type:complete len:387 (-) Transcript_51945:29-1189(-)